MKKLVILCVDDEAIVLESLKIDLKKALQNDYLVETAESGEEALELLEELREEGCEVAVAISDYIMPGMKGDEVLKQIHAVSPNTLNIMLTGQADVEAVGNAINSAKLYRYISKPWQAEDLKLTVRKAVHSYIQEKKLDEQNAKLQQLNQELENLVEQRTAELRLSEEKFAKAFRSSPNSITITRFRDGCHIEVNEAFCQMVGYASEEIIGRTAAELNLWMNAEKRAQMFDILSKKGVIYNYEFEFRTKSGEVKTALLSAEIINIHGEECLLALSNDITYRKRAEEELRASQASLAAAQRIAHIGSWEYDIETGEMTLSEELFRIFGLEPAAKAPTYSEIGEMSHPEDRAALQKAFDRAISRGISWEIEHRIVRPDGSVRYLEIKGEAVVIEGRAVRLFGTAMDVSDRKLAEAEIIRSKDLLESIFNESADAIFLVEPETGLILDCNRRAVEMYEARDKSDLLNIEGRSLQKQSFTSEELQAINTEIDLSGFWSLELEYLTKQGNLFWGNLAAKQIHVAGQKMNLVRVTDITDRKQVELALQKAKEAADRANRAKSEFLSNMSHELRTPLNAILGFTQLLARDKSLKPEQQDYLGIISRSGEHLLALIDNILQMSKIEVGLATLNKNIFDLSRLLDSLEEMLQLQAKNKGLQLTFERAPNLPKYLQTDESKLRQVLINLLGNAIKFTAEGCVTLRVKPLSTDPIEGDRLSFEVEDTGPGIAPHEIDDLFKPFVQTETGRRLQEGTGLGLPISRQFVQLMGGDIAVSSTVGKGSIFKFEVEVGLEADAVEIQAAQPARRPIGLEPGQPEYRVLVADDRRESRLLLVTLLQSLGFSARDAENGRAAVELWESWQPHLIWMDMRMPVMDGYEATKRIKSREKGQATVIIALTASAFEEERQGILSAGCDDFVAKPFREPVILEKMAQYLGVRFLYEESTGQNIAFCEPAGKADSYLLDARSLAVMPGEWLNELYEAAASVDDERILHLLSLLPPERANLSRAIADLVNHFRCDRIIDLIEELRSS